MRTMKTAQAFLAALLASAATAASAAPAALRSDARRGALAQVVARTVSKDTAYPVSKVITLLQDMQAQLQKEADEDQVVYDKMICWCQTNDREKTAAVADAQTRINELTTTIETTAADSARLQQEIKNHEEDLVKSQESLDTATALREKQLAEFNAEDRDMLQSIKALDAAIVVISKHFRGAAFLERGMLDTAVESVRYQLQRHQRLLLGSITPRQRRIVLDLRQMPSYQPASGEIFGILKQMKETFEANLAETQKDEASNRQAYEDLKAAKEAEIVATRDSLDQKRTQLADTDEKNALAREELEDTKNALSYDDQFLLDLKSRCASTQAEYDARVNMRQQELQAVAEAITILNDDQARDTFSKVLNAAASLLQRSQRRSRRGLGQQRTRAAAVLSRAAGKAEAHSAELAALAVAVRMDPMTKVKAAIDGLIQELIAEKKAESRKRDSCIGRTNENERLTESFTRDASDLQSKMDGFQSTIKETADQLDMVNQEIADLKTEIKRKGEDREKENKDFQGTVADQQEMQGLLTKALQVLKAIYKTREVAAPASGAALVQARRQPTAGEAPPAGFSTYGANRGSGGVLGLLEKIIADTANLEKEAVRDEQQAQKDYEDFVKDTNMSIDAKQKQVVNLNAAKAGAEQALIAAKEDLGSKSKELENLASTASAIKMDCDFLVRNFDVRTQARDEEIEALQEAKAVLSGMRT